MASPKPTRAVHQAADSYEGQLRARFLRAAKALQQSVPINDLAMALRNPTRALLLLPKTRIREALAPIGTVLTQATLKGGTIGAAHLNSLKRKAR